MALTVAELRAVFSVDDSQYQAGLARIGRSGEKLQAVGRHWSRSVTLPLLGAGVAAFKMGSDFEKSMSLITGLVGINERQVSRWSRQVLSLSKTLPQSPKELADALFFVTSAGFRGKQAMDVLTASARASAAGLGETATVADAVTSAVNAYGIKNISAAKATDILTAAVREGKLEAASLAPVLGRVIPLASELGVSFDEVSAAIAAMSRTGMRAEQGSDATASILRQLIQESPMGVKALNAVSLSYDDVRRSLRERGLLATLMDLREAFDGNLPKMRAVFQDATAMTGVLALTGVQADTNVGIFERLGKATGDTDKAVAAAAKTTDFKLRVALNSLKVALIDAGDAITPFAVDLTQALAGVTAGFSELNPEQQKWVLASLAAVAAAGPLLFLLGSMVRVFALLAKTIVLATKVLGLHTAATWLSHTTLATWIGVKYLELTAWLRTTAAALAHRAALLAGAVATGVLTAATWLWNAALRANPIGIVITLIAALVAGVIYAYKHFGWFRNAVDAAWAGIKDGTRIAVLWLVDKMLWWAETVLGLAAKAFGWAPGIGEKLKLAHAKVKGFREQVNRELDAIEDEIVNVYVGTKADFTTPSEGRAGRGGAGGGHGGGHGGGGHGGGGPDIRVNANSDALGSVNSRARGIAARLATELAATAAGRSGVLPAGAYSVGMPYLGYPGHYGADYPAAAGTPVRAMAAGMVSRAMALATSYGKHVFLEHPDGVQTRYAHLSGMAVQPGQRVSAGQLLGWVGSTGNSTGNHLHFEYRRNGVPVNPASLGLFDSGGWLIPGVTVPVNKTGKPEAVLTPDESAAFVRIARQLSREGVGSDAPDLAVLAAEIQELGDRFEAALRHQTDREAQLRRTGAMR